MADAATRERAPHSLSSIQAHMVDACNALSDLVDFLDVVELLTTHPDRAEHEAALAGVLRHAVALAINGRNAGQRASDALLREILHG